MAINNAGEFTFQEAFDRTGRIINVTVAPMNSYDPPRLLNYLTAPHVCVWSAAVASCAIPFVFDAVPLIVREPNGEYKAEHKWQKSTFRRTGSFNPLHIDLSDCGEPVSAAARAAEVPNMNDGGSKESDGVTLYTDGSVESDLPMQQLGELFNVNHFIVSQVNPHSVLFSASSMHASVWSPLLYGACVGYVRFMKGLLKDWIKNLVDMLVYRSKAPIWAARRGLFLLLTQEYEGREQDITIMPWKNHISLFTTFLYMIRNPDMEEYDGVIEASERATWPYIARVQAHCAIESTLDSCVQKLRAKIATMEEFAEEITTDTEFRTGEGGGDVSPKQHTTLKKMASNKDNFMTSRSHLNLNRLAVADPPVAVAIPDENPAVPANRRARLNSGALVSPELSPEVSGARHSLVQNFQRADSMYALDGKTHGTNADNLSGEFDPARENSLLNLAVPSSDIPLHPSASSLHNMDNVHSDSGNTPHDQFSNKFYDEMRIEDGEISDLDDTESDNDETMQEYNTYDPGSIRTTLSRNSSFNSLNTMDKESNKMAHRKNSNTPNTNNLGPRR